MIRLTGTSLQLQSILTAVASLHSASRSTTNCKVEVTLRLTVSQSVSLGVEPHLGLMTGYLLLFDSYGLAFVGRSLWREDGSVFCICPCQLSLSRVWVPWDIWDFPFRRLLRLAGSRWRYSTPPPHGRWNYLRCPLQIFGTDLAQKTHWEHRTLANSSTVIEVCLHCRCIETTILLLLAAYAMPRECV
jgi:hypothetical protein